MKVVKQSSWGSGNTIKEGKNIISVNIGVDREDEDAALDYIDKKYNEGWEIVANDRLFYAFILHKKDRSVRKEPRAKPWSKKESVKVLL